MPRNPDLSSDEQEFGAQAAGDDSTSGSMDDAKVCEDSIHNHHHECSVTEGIITCDSEAQTDWDSSLVWQLGGRFPTPLVSGDF